MFRWIPFPMVRIVAFFIAGILCGYYNVDIFPLKPAVGVLLSLIALYGITVLLLHTNRWIRLLSGLIGLSVILVAGFIHTVSRTESRWSSNFAQTKSSIDYYTAEIDGPPEERLRSIRYEVRVTGIHSAGKWSSSTGRVQLYIMGKSKTPELHYGDRILVTGAPVPVQPPFNPGEFDYRAFLALRQIAHQQWVRPDRLRVTGHASHHGMMYYAQQARGWAAGTMEHYVTGERNKAVIKALILGVTDGIDNDLQGAYAASGTLHVLSVSGLHVGIIYGIILFLLKPFTAFSGSRWLIAGISLTSLWSYAVITGLSPSVLRSVTMFSFVAIARPVARDTNIYNTLAASAFLLLLYDPFLIMSVGFQLSYLALIGIVYLQRPLYQLWNPDSLVWDKIWQVSSMSLAAQLATFPLGLYYFHQFPVYFMVSNLIVIPLSSLALIAGVVLLLTSPLPVLAHMVSYLVQGVVIGLNQTVVWIEQLPFSVIDGVMLTTLECILLMALLIAGIRMLETKKFRFVILTCSLVLLFCGHKGWSTWLLGNRDQLIVYHTPGHGMMEWTRSGRSYFFSDSTATSEKDIVNFHVQPNRIMNGVKSSSSDRRMQRTNAGIRFFVFGSTRVVWINQGTDEALPSGATDLLIVGHDAIRSMDQLVNRIKFNRVVLDASNSPTQALRLVAEAKAKKILIHSVLSEGAFILNR